MTDRELMQQALDALKVMRPACFAGGTLKAADTSIVALRDRLAQPEQEHTGFIDSKLNPIKRPWVGLTDEEIKSLPSWWPSYEDAPALVQLVKDVEAKLKEKNT
jgi:hypothetical protein